VAPALLTHRAVVATHCPYCAFQCGTIVERDLRLRGDDAFPVNRGALCIKGWTATDTIAHRERLLTPLVRDAENNLVPATWDEAFARIATLISRVQREHGRDAVGVFGGGSLTNEKAYLLGKLARVALRTANIDYNGRYCMSSAAAAANRAFGIDRGLPFPVSDIARADAVLLCGANVAETMPPIMQWFEELRSNSGALIVLDPRRTPTAANATLHLPLIPGTDAAVANGLLHILLKNGRVDHEYIRERTTGFEDVRAAVAAYWPERVERITGVAEQDLIRAARILGRAKRPMLLTARGTEQHAHGVDNVLAFINLALALGAVGRPYAGWGCLTGQGNGQGGREHGQKADQLPGYRSIKDPAARAHMAKVWDIDERELPGPGLSAYELLTSDALRGLIVFGSNLVVSSPNANKIQRRLEGLEFLVVADFFLSETAALADVVLPSAQWLEETGTLTNLEGRVILRNAVAAPPGQVKSDLDIICGIANAVGTPFSYSSSEDVFNELRRATAGGIADYNGITYERIRNERGVFWPCPSEDHPGTERLFGERFPTDDGRARFFPVHHIGSAEEPDREYPLRLTTGRVLAQYQSGTQTRRIGRLRELAPEPFVEIHPTTAAHLGLSERDFARVESRRGTATARVRVVSTIRSDTVFMPFHFAEEGTANRLTNPALDPISRMPEFKVCAVRVSRVTGAT
jgi:assimilatory nitrate reductase catalytic subunit